MATHGMGRPPLGAMSTAGGQGLADKHSHHRRSWQAHAHISQPPLGHPTSVDTEAANASSQHRLTRKRVR
eukprot:11191853-Lingulodinium_polyedra.AAC.1